MPGQFPPPPGDEPKPSWFSPASGGQLPLDANRVFSLTFGLFRHRRRTFFAIALLILVPIALLQLGSDLITGDATDDLFVRMRTALGGGTAEFPSSLFPLVGLSLLVSAIYSIASYVAEAGITKAAMDTYSGLTPDATDSVKVGLRQIVTLTVAYLINLAASFAVIVFGSILASFAMTIRPAGLFIGLIVIVAAFAVLLFITVRWSLLVPVVVIEHRGPLDALGRSWRLVAGTSWRVLGYVIAFGVLLFVLGLAVAFLLSLVVTAVLIALQSPVSVESLDPLVSLGSAIVIALLLPIQAIGFLLLYLDIRFQAGRASAAAG